MSKLKDMIRLMPRFSPALGRWGGGLFAILIVSAFMPSPARAWWNDDWLLRKKITIDTSSAGANITESIGDTPVLVRLHTGNFRFADAKDDGSDLRFIATDDKTPLKYHIEKYDSLMGLALVWVRIPNIAPGTRTQIWLYYNNKKAAGAADAKGTYDPDTVLVYHFNERGTPAQDSSAWANGAQSVGLPDDASLIGEGLRLDGQHPITLPASPSLIFPDDTGLTWSVWFKANSLQRNAVLYSRHDGANALVIGVDDGSPFVEITRGGAMQRSSGGAPVAPGGWHYLTLTSTPGLSTLYLDGHAYATLTASIPALSTTALVGADAAETATSPIVAAAAATSVSKPAPAPAAAPSSVANSSSQPSPSPAATAQAGGGGVTQPSPAQATAAETHSDFVGEIDELEIAKIARPAGFVQLAAIGQGPDPSKLMVFTAEEETAGWISGYFVTILKSVTVDGWVIISILMVMALISFAVMIDKALLVNRQAKANDEFARHFRQISGQLRELDRGDAVGLATLDDRITSENQKRVRNSSLFRIYQLGVAELHQRYVALHGKGLSPQAIAAIRATLDGGLVRENQRLDRLMVLLTIAISGGPFLGLLGTVVGVMITFAAIAQSGDVNVNAIAPGIAAALVATVAGLGVAIPALFAYNYLITRIKNLSADMQVFVDEFTTKVAESFAGDDAASLPLAAE
jgi:biopolymer transport protein ExbB